MPRTKAGEDWLKGAAADIRDQRFAPIADQAMATWQFLRRNSNVEFGRPREPVVESRHRDGQSALGRAFSGPPGRRGWVCVGWRNLAEGATGQPFQLNAPTPPEPPASHFRMSGSDHCEPSLRAGSSLST
jgi:hypothetical protein